MADGKNIENSAASDQSEHEEHIFTPQTEENAGRTQKLQLGQRKNKFLKFMNDTQFSDKEQMLLDEATKFDKKHKVDVDKVGTRESNGGYSKIKRESSGGYSKIKCDKCTKVFYLSQDEINYIKPPYKCDRCIARDRGRQS